MTDPSRLNSPSPTWSADWLAVLQQFHERKGSAEAERALLNSLSVRTALDYAADFGLTWPSEITEETRYAFGTPAPLMDSPNPSDGPKPSWGPSPSPSPCPCTITGVSVPTTVLVDHTVTVTIAGTCLSGITLTGDDLIVVSGPSGSTTEQTAEIKFNTYGTKSVHAKCGSSHVSAGTIVYQHDIKWNNEVVTGTTISPVVVGQKVTLDASWLPGAPPDVTYEWTVPEKCIKTYNMEMTPGAIVNGHQQYQTSADYVILTPAKQAGQEGTLSHHLLVFHPIAVLDDAAITLKGFLPQGGVEVATKLTVIAQASSFTGTVSSRARNQIVWLREDTPYGSNYTSLSCGNDDIELEKGIRFSGEVQAVGVSGEIAMLQLLKTVRRNYQHIDNNTISGRFVDTNGEYQLDRNPKPDKPVIPQFNSNIVTTNLVGPTQISADDSPLWDNKGVNFTHLEADNHFQMLLMYKPYGGIWVTLRRLDWNWSAKADRLAHDINNINAARPWTITQSSPPGSTGEVLTSSTSEALPIWQSRVQDLWDQRTIVLPTE